VNVLHNGQENLGVALRCDTVAEVENVSGVSRIGGENVVGRRECGIASGENGGRVEVALQNDVTADPTANLIEAHRLVDAQHRTTRVVHCLEKMRTGNAEVDTRDIGMQST